MQLYLAALIVIIPILRQVLQRWWIKFIIFKTNFCVISTNLIQALKRKKIFFFHYAHDHDIIYGFLKSFNFKKCYPKRILCNFHLHMMMDVEMILETHSVVKYLIRQKKLFSYYWVGFFQKIKKKKTKIWMLYTYLLIDAGIDLNIHTILFCCCCY